MLYCLLHKNKVIGLYSNYNKCNQMIDGLVANNFAKKSDLTIVSYYENSITVNNTVEEFTSDSTTESSHFVKSEKILTDELDKETKNKVIKNRNKQSKITYNVNLLKKQKEKIEESKSIYKSDIELFNKFKKIKADLPTSVIPELFREKYILMTRLEEQNNLSWESFHALYKKENIDTSYNKMFDAGEERKLLNISDSE
jgi:hypothetical protein